MSTSPSHEDITCPSPDRAGSMGLGSSNHFDAMPEPISPVQSSSPSICLSQPEDEDVGQDDLFQYTPLDSSSRTIRLLEVLPGSGRDPIRCNLQVYHLDECPPYCALSYAWGGNSGNFGHIECHGKSLVVRGNLRHFLEQFRLGVTDRLELIWIDALCINQNDVNERNHQVGQMRDIYSKAESVIVWLGDEHDGAKLAFEFFDSSKRLNFLSEGTGPRADLPRSKKQWKALGRLFNRPYWKRVWIIQEIILAKSVILSCGSLLATASAFEDFCRWISSLPKMYWSRTASATLFRSPGWTLMKHRALWWRIEGVQDTATSAEFSLQYLLRFYLRSESSEIRDRIYAFLGIASGVATGAWPIHPDYSKQPVQIAVEVIRNQCKWGTIQQESENNTFINLLKRVLAISSVELAFHILEYASDLRGYLHVIAELTVMPTTLHFISTIVEAGFNIHEQGIVSKTFLQDFDETSRDSALKPPPLTNTAASNLLMRMKCDDTPRLLRYEQKFSWNSWHNLEDIPTTSWTKRRSSTEVELDTHNTIPTVDNTLKKTTPDSVRNTIETSMSGEQGVTDDRKTPDIFVGTNGVVGYTMGLAQPGDHIFVHSQGERTHGALILRDSNSWRQFVFVGSAIFQPGHPGDKPLVSLPSTNGDEQPARVPPTRPRMETLLERLFPSPKRSLWKYKHRYGRSPQRPLRDTDYTFLFHPIHLANLIEARVLAADTLPRIVEQAFLDGSENGWIIRRWMVCLLEDESEDSSNLGLVF